MILVQCGAKKLDHAARPCDLYVGPLFALARSYAESMAGGWIIISAQHGALDPYGSLIEPYDFQVKDIKDTSSWAQSIVRTIGIGPHLSIMASGYDLPLRDEGAIIENPLDGLAIGHRMHWLKKHKGGVSHDRSLSSNA